jgi:hypothetical protein
MHRKSKSHKKSKRNIDVSLIRPKISHKDKFLMNIKHAHKLRSYMLNYLCQIIFHIKTNFKDKVKSFQNFMGYIRSC